ncbi:hypothetical protein EJB05_25172, partial [Eragrostis curvula]
SAVAGSAMAQATPQSGVDLLAQQGGVAPLPLPQDAVYEILLRLSARDICRLRAVCRPWRSLFSDPQFIAAHKARHPTPPLVVLGYHTTGLRCPDEQVVCDMVDLSGKVLRRVHAAGEVWVTSVNRDFVCTSKDSSYCIRLFNMKTGDVFALPEELSEEHAEERDILEFTSVAAIGQVASTGEHKVLRVLDSFDESDQLCEVFNLDGSSHARWRAKKAPPTPVSMTQSVVVNNIVYFFDYPEEDIASFDLEREEWMPVLQGLHYQQVRTSGNSMGLSMAAVNGCLVLVRRYFSCYVDLWFLVDFERGLWEKRHSIRALLCGFTMTIHPLLVLNDGRIVVAHEGSTSESLKIYNPRTNTYADVANTGRCCAVGLYSGSLLSLTNRQIMWLITQSCHHLLMLRRGNSDACLVEGMTLKLWK